ncbi:MAG: YlxR family protein [bacterium]|nr:YlxR family protein [bacterium]
MKIKKVPERTCVGCKTVKNKKELLRIVRTPEGNVELDAGGKKSGRGVYICCSVECLAVAQKGNRLGGALETVIPAEVISRILERIKNGR